MMEKNKIVCQKSSPKKSRSTQLTIAKSIITMVMMAVFVGAFHQTAFATGVSIDFTGNDTGTGLAGLELLFVMMIIALAPSILIMMTSFTRIVIVFSFLRNAIGLQQTPPNQIIIGLSLFLSLFIMQPVIDDITNNSITPYMEQQITQEVALERMADPLKEFMLRQTKPDDIEMFLSFAGQEAELTTLTQENLMNLGMEIIVPSFITSELKHAFTIGFLLFLPFLVIDMIVSSTLMSMGMVMLPPSMIALPFKLMLFVVADGWSLIMEMLVLGFK